MDFFVIADRDTVTGFACSGVPGVAVQSAQEAAAELDRLARSRAERIVITTEQVADTIREKINAIRFGGALPLIVEVPGLAGPSPQAPSLLKLIQEAVGIKF
jgi:vacuolar-type H+-ATPase subunit F/Vma7